MSETRGPDQPSPQSSESPPPPPPPPQPYSGQGYPPPPGANPAAYPQGTQGYPPPGQGYYQQFPGYPGGPPGTYGSYDEGPTGYSGLAIAAFVTGLVLPILGLVVAIPLGIVALVKMSGTRLKGRWMAIAGIVLPILWIAGFAVLGFYLESQEATRDDSGQITEAGLLQFGDVQVGDCLDIPDPQGSDPNLNLTDLEGVPCSDAHNAEAVLIVPVDGDDYPGASGLDQVAQQPCHDAVVQATDSNAEFLAFRLRPEEPVWNDDGGHRVLCFAISSDGGDIDDLPIN
jgi:hypothetical protein